MAWWNKTLTISDLIDIDKGRIDRSKDLRVVYVGTDNIIRKLTLLDKIFKIFKKGPKYIFYKVLRYKVISNSGNNYTVLIKISPGFDTKQFMKNRVEVFCTCADFKYRAAYGLNKTDNLLKIKATIDHLGEAITTAPTSVSPTPVCKHIFAVINHMKNNLKKLDLVY